MLLKLFVFIAFVFTQTCAHGWFFQNHNGTLEYHNGTLIISCNKPDLITDVFSPLNKTISVDGLTISLCKLSERPLVDIFKDMNINFTNMTTLSLSYVDSGDTDENITKGLMIQSLELKTKRKPFEAAHNFFKPLSNLKNLTISGVELPSIPSTLEALGLLSDASVKSWNGCQNLRELSIKGMQSKKQISEEWPENCTKLKSMKFLEASEETIQFLMKTIVPKAPNLRLLSVISSKLHDFPFDILHNNITYLDLRNNRFSSLSREQLSQLFGTRARRILFGGNPVKCKCDNGRMLESLHINQSQILDYEGLLCSDSKQRVRSVSVPEICRFVVMSNLEYGLGYVWGLCCSISVFSVILLILTRRYGPIVRTILYSRGYCVSCLRYGIDADRPYDAFLSFAHGDDEFVLETLLPRLEDTPNDFSVCIHYRDWAVGEWIPAQIMQSVRQSKRTIIVLSKNFVKSWWGVLEFRYAHASAMAEGRSRLLVLILDDVLNEKLQPELQGYLEYHTFLRCNDPFFWDKLRYAMPHKDNMVEVEHV